ncbi:MAG: hypothetical protein PWP39_1874 [Pyrococcus sp.]|nr:hypothetical protein [Pyrococcus sp.]
MSSTIGAETGKKGSYSILLKSYWNVSIFPFLDCVYVSFNSFKVLLELVKVLNVYICAH